MSRENAGRHGNWRKQPNGVYWLVWDDEGVVLDWWDPFMGLTTAGHLGPDDYRTLANVIEDHRASGRSASEPTDDASGPSPIKSEGLADDVE